MYVVYRQMLCTQAHDKVFGRAHRYQPKGVRNIPVGSASYMSRHENAIPVDEAFLFRYFVESGRRTDGTGVNARPKSEDVEDLDSDEVDEFLGDINNHVSSYIHSLYAVQNCKVQRRRRITSIIQV